MEGSINLAFKDYYYRSMQAIKAQARREMEAEKAAQEQQQRDAQALAGPKEVHLEAAPMLAVQGVLFHCPLIGKLSLVRFYFHWWYVQ